MHHPTKQQKTVKISTNSHVLLLCIMLVQFTCWISFPVWLWARWAWTASDNVVQLVQCRLSGAGHNPHPHSTLHAAISPVLHLLTSVDSRTSGVRSYKSVVTTTDQWSWDCFLRSHVSVAHWPRVSTSSSHWLWCSESLASSVVVSTVLIFTWLSLLVVSIFSVDNTCIVSCLQVRCFRWCSPALVSQQENQWRQIYLWFLKSEGVDHLLADHEHHWNYWTSCGNGWATNICETWK